MMTNTPQITYQITIEGHLDARWAAWFDGMHITHGDTTTTLYGPLPDQAALFGVLKKLHNLGLSLIAVQLIDQKP